MIPGVLSVPDSTASTPAVGKNTLGKDDFLKLLIAQLQAQDPLEPLDAQDFSAQLAQFTTLEQITNVNENLTEIKTFEQALSNSAALNLIGKQVEAPGNVFQFVSGTPLTIGYGLEHDASEVTIDIFDFDGNKVKTLTLGEQGEGAQRATWTGLDSAGQPVETGTYTFQVIASDASGNSVETLSFTQGVVSDVIFENGQAFVRVNGEIVPISEIIRVSI